MCHYKDHLIPTLHTLYLLILGITLGAILTLGIFVAPIVFKANLYLPLLEITRSDSGILMSQIFLKFNRLLYLTAISIILYEGLALWYRRSHKIITLAAPLALVAIALFAFYYTPYMIEVQKESAELINSAKFQAMHKQSEWVFKLLLPLLITLFAYRLFRPSFKPLDHTSPHKSSCDKG